MYPIFFIHSSFDRHLDCFHVCCCEHWGGMYFFELWFSVDIRPGVRLLECIAALLLVFQGTSILFSAAEAPTCSLKVTTVGKHSHTQRNTVLFCLVTLFWSVYFMFLKDLCLVLLILSTVLLSFHFSHYFYCLPPSFCGLTMLLSFFFPPNFSSYTLTPFIPSVSCFPINIVKVLISLMRCFSTNLDIVIQHKP